MTKSEAIHRRVLRCRPGHSNAYVTTHEALLAEAEYLQKTEVKPNSVIWVDAPHDDWITWMFASLFGALVTSGIAAVCMVWWSS